MFHIEFKYRSVVVVGSVPLSIHISVCLSVSHSIKDFCTDLQFEETIYCSFGAVLVRFRPFDITLHVVHQRG
jgi:hypothetical protein